MIDDHGTEQARFHPAPQLPLPGIPQAPVKYPTVHIACKGYHPNDATVTLDDGRQLHLRAVQLNMAPDSINKVVCEVYDATFDVDAEPQGYYMVCPLTGKRKRVAFLEFFDDDPQEMPDIVIQAGELRP